MRNVLIVTKAVGVALWFHGLGRLFDLWMPNKGWIPAFLMLFVSTLLLLIDDGDLSELHRMEPPVAAIVGSRPQDDNRRRK